MDAAKRKKLLPRGAQTRFAKRSAYSAGFISEVVNGKAAASEAARIVASALARRMKGRPPERAVFPEYFQRAS